MVAGKPVLAQPMTQQVDPKPGAKETLIFQKGGRDSEFTATHSDSCAVWKPFDVHAQ